jgi:hypothetical protein
MKHRYNAEKLYYELTRQDPGYEGNMPELPAMMFLTLFNDESWTWHGFATLLKARFSESDVDTLREQLEAKS